MNLFLILAFLFFVGSVSGWILELIFRRFVSSSNPERKWINPGFCTGPYLPLYGCGLCLLYLIASLERFNFIQDAFWNKTALFFGMAVCMTAVEYVAGLISLKIMKVRLWDYRKEWGNIQGIICPKFSLAWAVLGAVYYFAVHPHILDALAWLSRNLAFSFVIGLFFGVFVVDAVQSAQLMAKLKEFAEDNEVIVKYQNLKAHIHSFQEKAAMPAHFFRPLRMEQHMNEHLKELLASNEYLKDLFAAFEKRRKQ